jgi:hypothetical protein
VGRWTPIGLAITLRARLGGRFQQVQQESVAALGRIIAAGIVRFHDQEGNMSKARPKRPKLSPLLPRPKLLPKNPDIKFTASTLGDGVSGAIGEIAWRWSYIEKGIEEIIWAFLNIDVAHGRVITSHLSFDFKRRMASSMADALLSGESLDRLKEHLHRATELYAFRNLCVHAWWGTLQPENVPAGQMLRESLESAENAFDPKDVVTHIVPMKLFATMAKNMRVCANNLGTIHGKISTSLHTPPSPETRE